MALSVSVFDPTWITVTACITYLLDFTQTSMWIKSFWFPTSNVSASIPKKLPMFQQERLQINIFQRLLLSCLDIKRG